jgi:hypothetical protein
VTAVSEPDRRLFVAPPAHGEYLDIDLAFLDPADPDERRLLIEAEHPELHNALEADRTEIHVDGAAMSPRLHITMHEVVANQIWDDDPPETWQTAQRLLEAGYDRHEVLHMLASVISGDVYGMLKEGRPHDPDKTRAALDALPESWEQQRAAIPAERHLNRAERRAAQRRHRH